MGNTVEEGVREREEDIRAEMRYLIMANDGHDEPGIVLDVLIRRLARLEQLAGLTTPEEWR